MTTGGGESEGGEAELRADRQAEVFQDGRLRTETEERSDITPEAAADWSVLTS